MTQTRNGDKDIPHTRIAEDNTDKTLFAEAMQGVTPLEPENKHYYQPPKPKLRRPKHTLTIKTDSITDSFDFNVHDKFSTHNVGAEESLLFHQKGLRLQELTRLKKGEFRIQGVLDLHGLILEDADYKLRHFIDQAWSNKLRFVLVIHGKGYNSAEDLPILKNLVNQRLQQFKHILAFCSALPKDGGTGAVYVLLKAH